MSTHKKHHSEDSADLDTQMDSEAFDEDIEPILDDEGDAGQAKKDKTAKLKEKLKHCEKEKQQYLDSWQREKAEFLNARKRDEEAKKQAVNFAREDVIISLLPVLDSFEMAFADTKAYNDTPEQWRIGVEQIHAQLLTALESHNVKQISPEGQPFDPAYHEAVDQTLVHEKEKDNTIVEVVQKGYSMNDRVIRSAKVKVGAHTDTSSEKRDEA
ncbi:MAG: nucleotide exchange factor GrpE [Candidatus Paceibacterota bacterium]